MTIALPRDIEYIIATLEKNGFDAYAVGGCVRDTIMGKPPKDWDICTEALPEQTIRSFPEQRIFETGLKHGTVSLRLNHETYEITTFRTDGEYRDNRRPETVKFVRDIKEDLSRRDFTINSLAYHPKKGLIDYFGGISDIKNKKIRAVGNSDKRFDEDALRIMRALRIASVLGFEIETNTSNSIINKRQLLKNIAAERISAELNLLLCGNGVESIMLDYSAVIGTVIPEILPCIGFNQKNPRHNLDVWQHTIKSIANAPPGPVSRLTMLLHDIGKPVCYTETDGIGHFYGHQKISADMARIILRRLKYDNETVETVTKLIYHHDADIQPVGKHIKRWLNRLGEDTLRMLLEIKRADTMAHAEEVHRQRFEVLDEAKKSVDEVISQQQCFSIKDMAITGRDLIAIGITQGPEIGRALSTLLDMILDEEIPNDRKTLIEKTKELTDKAEPLPKI